MIVVKILDKPYLTLKEDGSIEIIIKKSQFICNIARTESEEQARAFIDEIKTKHRKATHNCFAYTLGLNDEIQRESDNGEPSGTAGVPMLDVLKKNQVHNVTAVVTRYFGGIKLGTGGLIRAYGGAVAQALKELGIVKRVVQTEISLTLAYPLHGKLQNFLEGEEIALLNTNYTDQVEVVIAVEQDQVDNITNKIIDLLNGKIAINVGENRYHEIDFDPHQPSA